MTKLLSVMCVTISLCVTAFSAEHNPNQTNDDIRDRKIVDGNVRLKNFFQRYSDNDPFIRIQNENDATSKLLMVVREIVLIDKTLTSVYGCAFLNIGFVGHNGKAYMSGIAPKAIEDAIDRARYEELLKLNSENLGFTNRLVESKHEFLKLLRTSGEKSEPSMRKAAIELLDSLQ